MRLRRVPTARIPTARIPTARISTARISTARISTARITAVLAGTALAVAGCSSSSSPAATSVTNQGAASGTVTVYAASSLTAAFTALGKQFEADHAGTKVSFSFGASSALAQQIVAGAPADVFASASAANMKQVTDAGAGAGAKVFATNTAEIAVAPRTAAKVHALADLAAPGLKVALCQQQVPCGALAHTVLINAKVTVVPVTEGLDVKSTLAYVTSGEADAAIVYVTDVLAAGSAVTGVAIPKDVNAGASYPIVVLKAGKNPELAQSFEDFVLSAAGQKILASAGFAGP